MMGIRISSEEHLAVIDSISRGEDIVVDALAGCGKTTVLCESASVLKAGGMNVVYLVFNKEMEKEAAARMGNLAKVMTVNGLAFRTIPDWVKEKLGKPKETFEMTANRYGLNDVRLMCRSGDEISITAKTQARMIRDGLVHFCASDDDSPLPRHIPRLAEMNAEENLRIGHWLLRHLVRMWGECLDRRNSNGIDHGVYMKLWALNSPKINADVIMMDETQDTDELMAGVMNKQGAQKIWVGDKWQQIYEWRGAVNAMAKAQGKQMYLRESFRFGPRVAKAANAVLEKMGEKKAMMGVGADSSITYKYNGDEHFDAIICRTNTRAFQWYFDLTEKGMKVKMNVDMENVKRFARDCISMNMGRPATETRELSKFRRWSDVVEFSRSKAGEGIAQMVKFVEKFEPKSLLKVVEASEKLKSGWDVEVSTCHKAKGKEWDTILIDDDFVIGDQKRVTTEAELRLFYVALTRVRRHMNLGKLRSKIVNEFGGEI